nr:MAG TPA: hypothetical protein [Caudoviricetes sp.]
MEQDEKRKIQKRALREFDLITDIITNDESITVTGYINEKQVTKTYNVE